MCVLECGFPYRSVKKGSMASSTLGSNGVVACMSRYSGRPRRVTPFISNSGSTTDARPSVDATLAVPRVHARPRARPPSTIARASSPRARANPPSDARASIARAFRRTDANILVLASATVDVARASARVARDVAHRCRREDEMVEHGP